MAQHKIEQKNYRDYLSIEEAGKELIVYAVGDDAVAPLKKQYIGFGDTTVLQMIEHLRLKTAIKQNQWIQQSVGPHNEHHRVLHATR